MVFCGESCGSRVRLELLYIALKTYRSRLRELYRKSIWHKYGTWERYYSVPITHSNFWGTYSRILAFQKTPHTSPKFQITLSCPRKKKKTHWLQSFKNQSTNFVFFFSQSICFFDSKIFSSVFIKFRTFSFEIQNHFSEAKKRLEEKFEFHSSRA